MEQAQYLTGEALIWRECPVYGCVEQIRGESHTELVKETHGHLRGHDWNEKRHFL